MQDLVKKIEELRDLVKGLLAKPGQNNSLVPALKPPSLQPISMPNVASKPTKIPGVAPSTNKDPKKVAEQLKNPRARKPKMEMLKFDKNGQWTLEKASKGIHVDPGHFTSDDEGPSGNETAHYGGHIKVNGAKVHVSGTDRDMGGNPHEHHIINAMKHHLGLNHDDAHSHYYDHVHEHISPGGKPFTIHREGKSIKIVK